MSAVGPLLLLVPSGALEIAREMPALHGKRHVQHREILRGAMSQENVEIVRQAAEAFDRGDFESALEAFHPEVIYEVLPATGPEPGVHHGHEGLREAFGGWIGSWEEYESGLEELIDAGDYVVAIGWDRGRASGIVVERQDVAFVYQLDAGKIVHAWMHATRAEALQAAGLSE